MTAPRSFAERAYRLLLRLYPDDFRERYAAAMTDFQRDRVREARAAGHSLFLVWARALADVTISGVAERMAAPRSPKEPVMRTIPQDVSYALRGLARRPAFTGIVVATIALGVGANAAIFSVVNGILLRPLAYPHAERVFAFGHAAPQWLTSEPNFVDYRRDMTSLDGLAAFTQGEATLTSGDAPERIRVVRASDDFFAVLGVAPMLGRTFAADEYRGNPPTVVVISQGLWKRMGADRALVNGTISVNGVKRTVVGVMPPHFDYPDARTELWTPMPRFNPDSLQDRASNYLFMVGRVKPGATLERARNDARLIAGRIMKDYPGAFDPKQPLTPHLTGVSEQLLGDTRPYLFALFGTVSFVLLIACANVANLVLARSEGRRKEMAVRRALGASGRRLAAQLLTESLVLAFVGGALGLLIAWGGNRALIAAAPDSIPRLEETGIDWWVVAFAVAVSCLTGVLIGLVPAWRASRGHAAEALKQGGRSAGAAFGGTRGARRVLVVAEVALAVMTLSGAGMLLRSLWHLEGTSLGYDPGGVLTAKVSLPAREYNDARAVVFFDQLLQKVRAVPGVRSAGAAGWLPVVDRGGLWGVTPEGRSYPPGSGPVAVPQHVTPGYFSSVRLHVTAGRDFTDADREGAPYVAVVSTSFAKQHWPGANPLGQRFHVMGGDSPYMSVVGVVDDIKSRGFDDTAEPTMYFPYAQAATSATYAPRSLSLVVRTDGDPMLIAAAVRGAVRALDGTIPVSEVRTLASVVGTSVASRRFSSLMLLAFALLALVLAGIGTYGVISYGVSQRRYEIGVRMALGADGGSVVGLVMNEGVRMCVTGLVIGLAGSIALARLMRALLVGVPTVDAPTLGVTAALLLAVAALASGLPARRALTVSPTEALRGE